jgi:uncharacterized protein (TIRG00374 family)
LTKKTFISFLRYLFSFGLAALFLYVAFRGVNFEELKAALQSANYGWVLMLVLCAVISNLFRAWRWKYLLGNIKQDVSVRNAFSAMMVGYLVNNLLPRAGEFVRPYALARLEGVSASAAFATVVVERILDILSLLIVVAIALFSARSLLVTNFPWIENAVVIALAIVLVAIVFFLVAAFRTNFMLNLMQKVTRLLPKRFAARIDGLLKSFIEGFFIIKSSRAYVPIVIGSVFVWVFYILMIYFPFYGFNFVEKYSLDVMSAMLLNVVSSIGWMIPVPGATGTYQLFCIQALTLLFRVSHAEAAAYATATWAIGYLSTIAIGLFFFLRDNIKLADVVRRKVVAGENATALEK